MQAAGCCLPLPPLLPPLLLLLQQVLPPLRGICLLGICDNNDLTVSLCLLLLLLLLQPDVHGLPLLVPLLRFPRFCETRAAALSFCCSFLARYNCASLLMGVCMSGHAGHPSPAPSFPSPGVEEG